MDPVNKISGPVSVLDRSDVDTDQIIPKQFLKRVERTGFGEFLFHDWKEEAGWDLPVNPILAPGSANTTSAAVANEAVTPPKVGSVKTDT